MADLDDIQNSPEVVVHMDLGNHHFCYKDCSLGQSGQTLSRPLRRHDVSSDGNHAVGNFEAGLVAEHCAE